jgi:hypothetical protein
VHQGQQQRSEINVDQDFGNEPVTFFGRTQARKHRQRGVTLQMFLGLMNIIGRPTSIC